MARRRPSIRDDRGGQMMLFAAVILVLAFIALTGAVNRINQLASETVQEQGDPFFLEVEAVLGGVDAVVETMVEEGTITAEQMWDAPFRDALAPVLDHLAAQERSHGFLFSWEIVFYDDVTGDSIVTDRCIGEDDTAHVEFTLHDGVSSITMESEAAFTCLPDPSPPPPEP